MLEVNKIHKEFGGLLAVNDVSFSVGAQEILAIIGPNGAGKTTIFNLISGIYPLDSGDIRLRGQPITGLLPSVIALKGLARTFQNLQIFGNMTVLENIMVGRHTQTRTGMLAAALRWPSALAEEKRVREEAHHFLEMVGLADKADAMASALSFGQQRLVEIARSLAMEPQLLMLDEPAAGLVTQEVEALVELIRRIRDQGVAVLLVEHDMDMVMTVADRIVVLHYGQKLAEGAPAEIQSNDEVIRAYLGDESVWDLSHLLEETPHA
ncbi:MAG: ABC transporter ATP-binding protein [Anaerolineae bacterium]